ncbi:MAG: ribonuclease III domain-containing protein [Hydrogenoanaerobacterium sp.]
MLDFVKQTENPKQLSPLTLAFMGDVVYELLAREQVISVGSMPPAKLHKKTVEMVKASFQSRVYEVILPCLTEDEADIMRRGRNSSGVHAPKNADVSEYRRATGLEALFGYLYLCGNTKRLQELFAQAVQVLAVKGEPAK